MREILIISAFSFASITGFGQLYDAQWALGDKESVIDFRDSNNINTDTLPTIIYFTLTNASICDAGGNLLYYTNGLTVCGVNDSLINGTGLSPCPYSSNFDCCGLNIEQAALFIPMPDNPRYYYLFHFSNDALSDSRPGTIYYSVIDTLGGGAVIIKNMPVIKNVPMRGGGMTACKHANGRDYWLVMGASVVNKFYTFLVTPDSVLGPFEQTIGPKFPGPYDNAYSKFSQDGSLFATGVFQDAPVLLMNFDRCSGLFSNPVTIHHNTSDTGQAPVDGCASLEFSPNGRFLYITNSADLAQHDLLSNNIQDSVELYAHSINDRYGLRFLQSGPDGKIYSCTWNGGLKALHVINNPNLLGDSSNFVYGGQPVLTDNSLNLPNLINYKLGPLVGSGCDTIPTDIRQQTQDERLLHIVPNPADKYMYVEMGRQGNYEIELVSENGEIVAKGETRQVDNFDTEKLAGGVYYLRVTDKGSNVSMAKKVMVVH